MLIDAHTSSSKDNHNHNQSEFDDRASSASFMNVGATPSARRRSKSLTRWRPPLGINDIDYSDDESCATTRRPNETDEQRNQRRKRENAALKAQLQMYLKKQDKFAGAMNKIMRRQVKKDAQKIEQ